MAFTDTELMMLEQMTYVGGDACKLAGVKAAQVEGETIGERLSVFDEEALRELEKSGEEGQQWAAIIRYFQADEELSSLKQGETFRDENNKILATT